MRPAAPNAPAGASTATIHPLDSAGRLIASAANTVTTPDSGGAIDTKFGFVAIRDVLSYCPDSGVLKWSPRPDWMFAPSKGCPSLHAKRWNSARAGKPALTSKNSSGYLHGGIFGKTYLAHRVAWAIYHGEWPLHQIDHVNGDKADNRICNLRDVTPSENSRNISYRPRGSAYGSRYHRKTGKWEAAFKVNRKTYSFGYHSSPEIAHEIAMRERKRFGFTDRHGPTLKDEGGGE